LAKNIWLLVILETAHENSHRRETVNYYTQRGVIVMLIMLKLVKMETISWVQRRNLVKLRIFAKKHWLLVILETAHESSHRRETISMHNLWESFY
jgi:hypothetical protein